MYVTDRRTEPKILFGSRPVEPNVRTDFRKDAPLFFDSRTRPRPVSVEVSEIRFAKPPYLLSRLELQKRALLQVCRLGEKFSSLSRSTFLFEVYTRTLQRNVRSG